MRSAWVIVVAAISVLAPVAPAAAQEDSQSAYERIRDLGDQRFDSKKQNAAEFRAQMEKFFTDLIAQCETFRTRYADSPQLGEVMYEQAKAYFWRSRYGAGKGDDIEKGAALAQQVVAKDPKTEAAAKSRGLLIQYYKMNGKNDELLAQALAIANDFPGSKDAALALRYVAETYETLNKPDEADKAWERLAKEYPDTEQGKRAAGVLVRRRLKGSTLDLSFTAVGGESIDVAKYRGKVVLLYFWSPTDDSSKSNLKFIAAFEKPLRERGLVVLGVCLDKEKSAMETACRNADATWPEHFDGKKWDNEVAAKLGVRAIPQTVLVDRAGKVREIGLLGNALLTNTRQLIDETAK